MDGSVLVVIVNWNSGLHLQACLQALAAQSHRDFRAVVVDNGSNDGSPSLVAALDDARFSLVQLEANTGFAHANNVGARHGAGSEFVVLLNPDATPAPEWLAELIAAARAHPEAGAFGSHLVAADNHDLSDGTGDRYHVTGRAWRRDHRVPVSDSVRVAGEIFAPCAAAALYRRSAWEQAGGFDEDFFCYMEDVDLGFRLRLLGWQARHVPESVCYHAGSAITGRRSDFSTYYGQRNLVWTFVKNMPSWLFWLLLPAHLLLNALAPLAFLRRGQTRVVLRAEADAFRHWPEVWRKRRLIQSQRRVSVAAVWRALDKGWPGPAGGATP